MNDSMEFEARLQHWRESLAGVDADGLEEWLGSFVAAGMGQRVVEELLSRYVEGRPLGFPGLGAGAQRLVLMSTPGAVVSVRHAPRSTAGTDDDAPLVSSPGAAVMQCVAGGPLVVGIYEIVGVADAQVYDAAARLVSRGDRVMGVGDRLTIRPTRDLFTLESVARDAMVVEVTSKKTDPLIWTFDRRTLAAVGVTASSSEASRMQYCAAVLRHLDPRGSGAELLRLATTSRHHFVRWSATRHLAHVDRAAVAQALRAAVHDSHPHVRRAAVEMCTRLQRAGYWGDDQW